jgi:hypothetical protein
MPIVSIMKDDRLKALNELLKQEETTRLDFKRGIRLSSDKDKFEFAKDVSAFANTNGGFVVYGKEDKREGGRIVGIEPDTYDADQMQQIIAQRCNPPPVFDSELLKKDGKWFVVLEIPESRLKPHEIVHNREVWVRRGATSDRATQREREQMSPKKGKRTLEEKLELEGVPEESENWLRKSVIKLGRWYMMRVYGELTVSLRKEMITFAVFGLLCFVPLTYSLLQISSTHVVPSQWALIPSIFIPVLGVFLLLIVGSIPRLHCPDCNRQFAVRRKRHTRVRTEILHKTEDEIVREVTYHNAYACDFCKYKKAKFEPETETIKI